jgi:AraC family transcriptional regulator
VSPCVVSPSSARSSDENLRDRAARESTEMGGEILKWRSIGSFTLSEHIFRGPLTIPSRAHREAFITLVIEGTCREKYANGSWLCRPGGVRFLPAGIPHSDEIESALRCLHVASAPDVLDQLARQAVVPKRPAQINSLSTTWLANRLYAEFSREDSASAVAIEGLVLAILAEIARAETKPSSPIVPAWLRQATEIVESRFLDRLSLTAIASEVGVHYVHLSRQFHKYNHCTIGELIRRRRVQYASHLLAHSETPLAEIALMCGFSDQSHLSFLFKRYMGLSPSKFRSVAGRGIGPTLPEGPRGEREPVGAEATACHATAPGK